jgi:hypothetical protein
LRPLLSEKRVTWTQALRYSYSWSANRDSYKVTNGQKAHPGSSRICWNESCPSCDEENFTTPVRMAYNVKLMNCCFLFNAFEPCITETESKAADNGDHCVWYIWRWEILQSEDEVSLCVGVWATMTDKAGQRWAYKSELKRRGDGQGLDSEEDAGRRWKIRLKVWRWRLLRVAEWQEQCAENSVGGVQSPDVREWSGLLESVSMNTLNEAESHWRLLNR